MTITRIALIAIAAIALALCALCEVGLAHPVAWWLYFAIAIMFAVALIRPVPVRMDHRRFVVLVAVIATIALLYSVAWTSRKRFLRDLARVQVGMTELEVRHIMGRYMEGTGWPASPFDTSSRKGELIDARSGLRYATTTSPSGEMVLDSLVFRHSSEGAFNSDLGIVSLES